jgi:beta-glucosidase
VVANRRASDLLAKMTQDEKILLVHGSGFPPLKGDNASARIPGIARLGIPQLRYKDGASGIGVDGMNATAFPSHLALAASWDTGLMAEVTTQMAREGRALGFAALLGGGMNMAREPRAGRTFEYLGEDPVLAGEMMVARTDAAQSEHVIFTLKHLVGNDQETNRFTSNSVIDQRTLRELYLLPFEMVTIRSQPGSVICAYNLLNGEHACQSKSLLTDTLKNEWGFRGVVQSDWILGLRDTVAGANAGADQEQPSDDRECVGAPPGYNCVVLFAAKLKQAVSAGAVDQSRLDDMVLRYLRTLYRLGIMDNPPPTVAVAIDPHVADPIALKSAMRSMVLLKNTSASSDQQPVLPLSASHLRSIVVIGGHADVGVMGGGGSALAPFRDKNASPAVNCLTPGAKDPVIHVFSMCAPWYKSSPVQALRVLLPGVAISYVDGSDTAAAAQAAAAADAAIVFATQYSVEGVDLSSLSLPDGKADSANQAYDQNALISAVAASAKRTVVVLETATAVTMPWVSKVHGVLEAWFPGVRGGEAIANILTGAENPSGKLPLTFPKSEADLPQASISASNLTVSYSEGLEMGYRWYDAKGIEPLFPFGHGLSYTRFDYSGLTAQRKNNGDITVQFTLSNRGSLRGAEVAQLYVKLPAAAGTPPQRLVAFQRVELAANASKRITVNVSAARFAVWDSHWKVLGGTATLTVGGSSRAMSPVATNVKLKAMAVDHAR